MDRTPVISSNLRSIGYSHSDQILEVEFKGGIVQHFFDVPSQVYDEMMESPSKGAYFHEHVRNKYRCARA